jgi:hypothetical protein
MKVLVAFWAAGFGAVSAFGGDGLLGKTSALFEENAPRAGLSGGIDSLYAATGHVPFGAESIPFDMESSPAATDSRPADSIPVFFDMRMAFPVDDFQLGARVGFSVPWHRRIATDFLFDFEMRPYRRAVRLRESETLEYQLREERITFGPGILTRFPLGEDASGLSSAFVLGGGAGLSPAWYRGSNRAAPSSALLWLETGFRFLTPSGADWGLSYQFFPLPGVSSHRLAFSIGFRTGSK